MFSTVTLPATLWFFNNAKVKKDEILFIDARNVFTQIDRSHRKFSDEQIKNLSIISRLHEGKSEEFLSLVEEYIKNKNKIVDVKDINSVPFESMKISNFNTRTRAFVKIQDGCNNYCSYCIIPYARGNIRSKDINDVIREVKALVSNGYIEIVLTGIHTGHYGKDKSYDLSDLLNELCNIDGLKRIRISSIEITELDDKFLDTLKNNNVIVDHMHIPLQSGCDKTLKEMNRKYDTMYFKEKIERIRSIRPDISITTDVIVGFPNETEEDFNNTYNFIKDVNFSKLHVFPYSKRDGTKAASMPNQIDNETKKKRVRKLLELSNSLEINYMNKFIGKYLEIIPEKYENGYLIGHSSNYILVKCNGDESDIGSIKRVKINNIKYPYAIE
jgi:threonylcarbamoyladenosine tRNA methylthiotransferase MtaB